ncbi:MAG: FmdE family protein [Thermodesulfobacteriota bacterium]
MSCTYNSSRIEAVAAFHGHWCPGLAIGIRAAECAQHRFPEASDTDLIAVVETDMCGVDAIQFLTGCTLGKGNLIAVDIGKMAFTFFHRPSGEGFRALLDPNARGSMGEELEKLHRQANEGALTPDKQSRQQELRQALQDRYMQLPLELMFRIQKPQRSMPRGPQIQQSLSCASCGEKTMESRTRLCNGQIFCIPCFQNIDQKQ